MADLEDALKVAYQEVGSSSRAVEEFSAKLLGLLPLASGAGIFLLINGPSNGLVRTPFLLVPIGLFGCAITLGLAAHESRLQRRNGRLIHAGKMIERSLRLSGPFTLRAPPNAPGKRLAASIIYSAVFSVWLFLVVFSLLPESWWPTVIVTLIFLVNAYLAEFFQSFLMRKDSEAFE